MVKLVVVGHDSVRDIRVFSGVPHFMYAALEKRADVTGYVQVPPFDLEAAMSGRRSARRLMNEVGTFASQALEATDADVVLCLGGAIAPGLSTELPVVHWHDSTWHALLRLPFPEFAFRYPWLRDWDQRTLDRCTRVAYAAEWVRNDTLVNYMADPQRVTVVPFGANLPGPPPAMADVLALRRGPALRLTFIGVDWERKGLELAHLLLTRLRRSGIETQLTVLGADVEARGPIGTWAGDGGELIRTAVLLDPHIQLLGYVDKMTDSGRDTYRRVLSRTDYLVHPAEFECFGIVLAEAAAYGVPALALDQYGPQSVVRNGRTGHLFSREAFVDGACAVIEAHLKNPSAYEAEARAARMEYEERLNWDVAVDVLLNMAGWPR